MTQTAMTSRQSCDASRGNDTIQIALVRHAQADLHGRFCGHSNPNLTLQGREQIPAIIRGLSHLAPTTICCSDLQRAIETAEPIAEYFGLDYTTSPRLREMNFGAWEGLTWREVELQYPQDAKAWVKQFPYHRPPEGESFRKLQARVVGELEQLAKQAEPGCTLVITHSGFIRTAVGWVLGIPDERISRIGQVHGALSVLEKVGSHWIVASLNISASGL